MSKKGNEQAFPMDYSYGGYAMESGMTKREYFAAKALQAMISNPNIEKPSAGIAVEYADSLISALSK